MTEPTADPASGPARRQLTAVLVLIVLGAGGIVLVSARPWLTAVFRRQPPFGPLTVQIPGRHLYPTLNGLALVALVVAVLVLVTGGWARRALGGLLVLIAGWTGWYGLRGLGHQRFSPGRLVELAGSRVTAADGTAVAHGHPVWALLSLLGSVLLLVAGLALLARAGRWRTGLSSRYEAPARTVNAADPWRQLDRGEDPTIRDG